MCPSQLLLEEGKTLRSAGVVWWCVPPWSSMIRVAAEEEVEAECQLPCRPSRSRTHSHYSQCSSKLVAELRHVLVRVALVPHAAGQSAAAFAPARHPWVFLCDVAAVAEAACGKC